MTSYEMATVLNVTEHYLRDHWTRIVKNHKKKGIELYKLGRGDLAQYGIKPEWDDDVIWDMDALEIF